MRKFPVMLNCLAVLAVLVAAVSMLGCEWSGSNNEDGTAWNSGMTTNIDLTGMYGPDPSRTFVVSKYDMDPITFTYPSGASGCSITRLHVSHTQNVLRFTDNYGKSYQGLITKVVESTGLVEFNASGVTQGRKTVNMSGTFEGGTIKGTWHEVNGLVSEIMAIKL